MRKDVKIFLDSGSPSLYNKLMRQNKDAGHMGSFLGERKHDDYSFLKTDDYRLYRDNYIAFIKEHMEDLEVYANFDVINNAEETWVNQMYMEESGLNPLPVFHLGSDIKWLKMYMDKGYDYIALGGLIPNPPSILIPALDKIWSEIFTDKYGMPLVKVHGFAVTSVKLVNRWPWFSVDSTSWVKFGRYGVICVPKKINGKYDYTVNAWTVAVSARSPSNKETGKHFDTFAPAEQKIILNYIESKGLKLGKSEIFKTDKEYEPAENEKKFSSDDPNVVMYERIIEEGICNNYKLRDELNIMYYLDLEASIPEWPWAFKVENETKKFKLFK